MKGRKRVPKQGALFYVNHPGSFDVILLNIALGTPIGCFISWDNFWMTNIAEKYFTYINKQKIGSSSQITSLMERGLKNGDILLELMIRNILLHNRYFAIWPEGGLSHRTLIREGFSSLPRVYAVLNSKKNQIPLVPVTIRGSECYHIDRNPKLRPRTQNISLEFHEPFFLPREWIDEPSDSEKGKTPREIIDHMMLKLTNLYGQKKPIKNMNLSNRKAFLMRQSIK